jgi:hypothetical protein
MTPAAMPPALEPDLVDLPDDEAVAVGPFVMVELLAAEGS